MSVGSKKRRLSLGVGAGRLAAVLAISLVVLAGRAPAEENANPFLKTLSGAGVTVAYGTSDSSLQAAEIIRDQIRRIPGQEEWNNLMSAAEFDAQDRQQTGTTHVIAVGTLWDNVVLHGRSWLPTWWMDRDWYYTEYKFALTPEDLQMPYVQRTGFMVAGFGDWPKGQGGIGYVEIDRSNYFMEWMVRGRLEKSNWNTWEVQKVQTPTYPSDFPLRLIVRVTGSDGAGVVEAAKAFANRGMLNGVVLTDGAKATEGPAMFTLPQSCYTQQLPFTPPKSQAGLTYIGWLLPSALQYDGFTREANVTPQMMYRLKYMPQAGITNFWTTPHRRAGEFEVVVARFDNEQQASQAQQNLRKALAGRDGYKSGRTTDFNTKLVGSTLLVESLPPPEDAQVLDACARCIEAAKQ